MNPAMFDSPRAHRRAAACVIATNAATEGGELDALASRVALAVGHAGVRLGST